MSKKKYSISELIGENISMRKKLENVEIKHLKETLSILRLISNNDIDVNKLIKGIFNKKMKIWRM